MNQSPNKNYFTMPNAIFSLGLDASEIAVYAYLRCLENRSTYQCRPSYTTIGNAVGRAKNTVMRYVDALAEKGLIYTEPTSVLMRSGIKKNGNLRYTLRPIREAVEPHHEVDHRAAGIAAEAMPAAVSCVDLQRCGMISLMERAAHKSCAVWLEAIVPRNFVHRQTSLDLVRCVIRTVTRHRHHPGR